MMQGEELELWDSPEALDALDLCLSCKGCTNECPVNVDMPTLKAEFLAHHYAQRARPRHAYAFGLIDRWAGAASRRPRLANLFTQTPGLAAIAKAAAGVSQYRRLTAFATTSFAAWFVARGRGSGVRC